MHAASDLAGRSDSGFYVFFAQIVALVRRKFAIEWQVAGLGADQDFVTLQFVRFDQLLDRRSDVALRALVPVVDGGVEHINAGAECLQDRLCVGNV